MWRNLIKRPLDWKGHLAEFKVQLTKTPPQVFFLQKGKRDHWEILLFQKNVIKALFSPTLQLHVRHDTYVKCHVNSSSSGWVFIVSSVGPQVGFVIGHERLNGFVMSVFGSSKNFQCFLKKNKDTKNTMKGTVVFTTTLLALLVISHGAVQWSRP